MSSSAVDTPTTLRRVGRAPLVRARGLRVAVHGGRTEVVHGVDLEVPEGGAVGIVGESGSGKTLICRSLLGLLPHGVSVTDGELEFAGESLRGLSAKRWRQLRGASIAAVFQDPASYLNPSIPVGRQLAEVLRVRVGLGRRAARDRAVELFGQLGLRDPERVAVQLPHALSGGMLQRVLIAIAIAAEPRLLLADEATTALDVTVQAEVLDVLAELRERTGLALVLVSHDLAIVAQVCDTVYVVKDGEVVEHGPTARVLRSPEHPYTRELVDAHHAGAGSTHVAVEAETADGDELAESVA